MSTDSTYAGNAGENIDGVEIRIFEDDSYNAGPDSFSGSELNLSLSYMTDDLSNWSSFSKSVTASKIDGIKINTSSSDSFYLMYKSWNQGDAAYNSEVNSTGTAYNDYAGYPGQAMQLLSISAYSNDGTRLRSGVVVMYRVRNAGRWLPWVSNADEEWMKSVYKQYSLDGTLDTVSTYAGNSGVNIDGVEIQVFAGDTDYHPIGNLPGSEYTATTSYMTDSLSNWTAFTGSALSSHIDGIKIRTDPTKTYYLSYRSWNSGKTTYYPYVKSTGMAYNDYAGYPGTPIQLLGICVYRSDGVKLKSGVVVMYRAHVGERWLPWVSNADPEWMRSVQSKYNLGGILDTDGYYTGVKDQNINGIEIRVFEENEIDETPQTPFGEHKIIEVPFISQLPNYPTGCESVSTVMALNYAGIDISVDTFIDQYLDKSSSLIFDPNIAFGGNPRSTSGYGCYTPVIKNALDRILGEEQFYAKTLRGMSIASLCSEYIDNKNIPVIFWATQNMAPPREGGTWACNGRIIQWISPMHCLLLVGYDEKNYIFNDPLKAQSLTYYSKEAVEVAYAGLFQQAIVILNKPVISPSAYTAGVRLGEFEGDYYPDYTIPLNNLLTDAKTQAENHRCMSWEQYCSWLNDVAPLSTPSLAEHLGMQIASFSWFFFQVRDGAVWDIKLEGRWEDALPDVPFLGFDVNNFLFRGNKKSAEDMGNILYGYAGRATGFSAVTLYWGGGVAAKHSLTDSDVTIPPTYGDDDNDHVAIEYGFNLFNSDYPDYPEVGYEGIPIEDGILAKIGNILLDIVA